MKILIKKNTFCSVVFTFSSLFHEVYGTLNLNITFLPVVFACVTHFVFHLNTICLVNVNYANHIFSDIWFSMPLEMYVITQTTKKRNCVSTDVTHITEM